MAGSSSDCGNSLLKCNVCKSFENLKRCARCKEVVYCSREHQVSDWASHKVVCRKKNDQTKNDCDGNVLNSGKVQRSTDSINNNDDEGIEFDNRPLRTLNFEKPKEYDTQDLAKFVIDQLNASGFCVLDGLFEKSHLNETLKEVHILEKAGCMQPGKLAGGRTGGEENEKVVNANIRSDKLMWFEGNEKQYPNICKVIGTMDTILMNLNPFFKGNHEINRRTKAMVASYPGNGTYYRRHVDNPKKDGRLITCILYLNRNWDVKENGGLLRIFPEDTGSYVDIPPLLNRLLFFWSDRRNPHEVQPAFKNRYAITVWYFDKTEREIADNEQLNKDMKQNYGDHPLLEIATKKREKEEIENKIKSETKRVLGSLTDSELDAMAMMLEGQSNPKQVFQSIGISPIIQDKLLEVLKARETTKQ